MLVATKLAHHVAHTTDMGPRSPRCEHQVNLRAATWGAKLQSTSLTSYIIPVRTIEHYALTIRTFCLLFGRLAGSDIYRLAAFEKYRKKLKTSEPLAHEVLEVSRLEELPVVVACVSRRGCALPGPRG